MMLCQQILFSIGRLTLYWKLLGTQGQPSITIPADLGSTCSSSFKTLMVNTETAKTMMIERN